MTSLWAATAGPEPGPTKTLDRDVTTDVLVIGGGMAGMLCASMLTQAGCPCVVAEAKRVGSGVTQNTTAKATAQHGLIYDQTIKQKGTEAARCYYEANQAAVEGLRELARAVPCDFEDRTAYVYAEGTPENLERELSAYERLGIPHQVISEAPVPVANRGALGMEGQAQFNPLKLLYGLMPAVDVYEHTFVTGVHGNTAHTDHGSITADHVVFATHYPLVNIPGLYFMKLHQERSYALALQGVPPVDGMYIGEGGGFSFRTYQDYLLIGGGGAPHGARADARRGLRQDTALRGPDVRAACRALRLGDAGLHEFGQDALHRRASGGEPTLVRRHGLQQVGHDRVVRGCTGHRRFDPAGRKRRGGPVLAPALHAAPEPVLEPRRFGRGPGEAGQALLAHGLFARAQRRGGQLGLSLPRLALRRGGRSTGRACDQGHRRRGAVGVPGR